MATLREDGTEVKSHGRRTNASTNPKTSATSERAKLHEQKGTKSTDRPRATAYEQN